MNISTAPFRHARQPMANVTTAKPQDDTRATSLLNWAIFRVEWCRNKSTAVEMRRAMFPILGASRPWPRRRPSPSPPLDKRAGESEVAAVGEHGFEREWVPVCLWTGSDSPVSADSSTWRLRTRNNRSEISRHAIASLQGAPRRRGRVS